MFDDMTAPEKEKESVIIQQSCHMAGRVNGRISDSAEIRTPNFQLQYLLQLYSKNLTIVLEPFKGTL